MADNPTPTDLPGPSFEERVLETWTHTVEFYRRQQVLVLSISALILGGSLVWAWWQVSSRAGAQEAHRSLGNAFLLLENGKEDSAKKILQSIADRNNNLEGMKASLLLGDRLFQKGDWSGAEARYRQAAEAPKNLPILRGGAQRGLAAALIQQKKYAEAEQALQSVLADYQLATGNAKDQGLDREPKDLLPGLSSTQFQLVLVHEALGNKSSATKLAEDLVKRYPKSDDAQEAARWLALNS